MRKICWVLTAVFCMQCFPVAAAGAQEEIYSAADLSQAYCQQSITDHRQNIPDPGMISDEAYFGVYENGEAVRQSLLNYEKFPALSAVEQAAKEGDYYQAKEALLTYYRDKFANHQFHTKTSYSRTRNIRSRILFENIYPNPAYAVSALDIVKIEKQPQEYRVPIIDVIGNDKMTFALTGLKKDGMTAVFCSNQSGEHQPYARLVVNDQPRIYYPLADATICAGENKNINYGMEPTLRASESYSTIMQGDGNRVDEYTYRGYLLFDFSDINDGDTISEAELCVYGHAEASDNPIKPGYEKDFTDIVVYRAPGTDWQESTITFDSTAILHYNYDGENLAALVSLQEGPKVVRDIVAEYRYTGNEIFAYHAIRACMEKIAHNPATSYDGNTLYSSLYVCDMLPHLLCLMYSPHMTPEYFCALLKYNYVVTNEYVVKDWQEQHEICNFGSANAAGVCAQAMAFEEYRVADLPLQDGGYGNGKLGGWIAVAKHRIYYAAYKDTFADGCCTECSLNYTQYNLGLLSKVFTTAKGLNIDLTQWLGAEQLQAMQNLSRYLMMASNPNFGDWQQAHATSYDIHLAGFSQLLEWIDDDYLEYATYNRQSGIAPTETSKVWDIGKKATLRSDWTENAIAAQINADGGRNNTHGQNDDLGLNIYAYGRPLLMESTHKDYNYRSSVTGWLLSSKAVNAIEINNVTQKGAYGVNEEAFGEAIDTYAMGLPGNMHPENRELNDMYNFLRVETVNYQDHPLLKDDFTMYRDVLFAAPFFIVSDYIAPHEYQQRDNLYKQYWHSFPDANLTMDGDNFRTNFNDANIYVAPVQQEAPVTGNQLQGYWAVGSDYTFADYIRYDKTAQGATTFQTVLYPMTERQNISVSTHAIPLDVEGCAANAFWFEATDAVSNQKTKTHYYTVFDETVQAQRQFDTFATDGRQALVTQNAGGPEMALLREGTNLTQEDTPLLYCVSGISDLGVRWQGDTLTLETSKDVSGGEYPQALTENLAAAGELSVQREDCQSDLGNMTDGDADTFWQSAYASIVPKPVENAWITVTYPEETAISRVRLLTGQTADFYVYWSEDGANWNYIGETNAVEADGKYQAELDFASVKTRYLKVCCVEPGDIMVYELQTYKANSKSMQLENLTIRAPETIRTVRLNGKPIQFSQKDGYVYFGAAPILKAEDTPVVPPEPEVTPPKHGSSGGGGSGNAGGATALPPVTTIPDPPDNKQDPLPFADEIQGHWAQAELEEMLRAGLLRGRGESLELQDKITRAEFISLLMRILDGDGQKYQQEFSDITSADWYADDMGQAKRLGILEGYDGEALPNAVLSREQMAKLAVTATAGVQEGLAEAYGYLDEMEFSQWAVPYIEKATNLGLMKGMPDGCFHPGDTVLREQAFAVIYRIKRAMDD